MLWVARAHALAVQSAVAKTFSNNGSRLANRPTRLFHDLSEISREWRILRLCGFPRNLKMQFSYNSLSLQAYFSNRQKVLK
jgi:hypothetical protein